MQVMSIFGTRPEMIKMWGTLKKLDELNFEHVMVHTGQNFTPELKDFFFRDLQLRKPDYELGIDTSTYGKEVADVVRKSDELMEKVKPDALLILGDTYSGLSVLPAAHRGIKIFHMEAGNRCFDMRVPEETNRRIVDHTADVNLTYSTIARDYLLREGLPPDMVIKTGSPMFEVLTHYRPQIDASDILTRLGLEAGGYFIVSAHREENIESPQNFAKLVSILNAIAEDYHLPVIVSTHPRTQKRIDETNSKFHEQVRLLKPLGFHDYVKLQLSASASLSDSGTINEESSILNFPALNLREAHERPEGMEEAAVMMVGLEVERVRQGLAILAKQPRGSERSLRQVADYSMPNVSDKVVRIIHSYTDYVNRVVWKKY